MLMFFQRMFAEKEPYVVGSALPAHSLGIGGLEHIIFPVDQPVVLGSKLGGSLDGIAVGVPHQFSFIVEFLLATKL